MEEDKEETRERETVEAVAVADSVRTSLIRGDA
jgi:hypothetical protein